MRIALKLKQIDKNSMSVIDIGQKTLYDINSDNRCVDWIKESHLKIDCPQMATPIKIKSNGISKSCIDAIGHFSSNLNCIKTNQSFTGLYSSGFSAGSIPIVDANFLKTISYFGSKLLIKSVWYNCYDEYMIPNINHNKYHQWNNDCIILSIVSNQSGQSSLRNIQYKNQSWNIFNHFFFMSNQEMKSLANQYNFRSMYQDCQQFNEDRYVYNLLQTTELSPDAEDVLNMVKDLVRLSFERREEYNNLYPKQQLQCWDAGWAQLKSFLKSEYSTEYKEFISKYKLLCERMRPLVYELEFLRE